ncbi:hypothetical protein Pla8534_65750 [Lignipirellula cremea]|uniref:Mu-like prophage protein Com n=1 Tax=Lignipirellula cremea TaxID=2528010 RepID=A0A518E3Q1_9BACT|nr:hypothetical protein Pla8534_65750 [Lignipirellula cremea]
MSVRVYFRLICPTCSRSLNVPVAYLGKKVACKHCHAKFDSFDAENGDSPPSDSGLALMKRAEELLQRCDCA